jgi:hypothetical protein
MAAARPEPPGPNLPGWNGQTPLPAHACTMVTGGMPGWQITFIAARAAMFFAVLAVRAARRATATTT